ncbi:hypothetical protein ALC62_03360, partial [Cyphomyrmex costatus]
RLAGLIAVRRYLLHQLQSLDNVAEDAGKAAHLLQNYAKLRADHAEVVVPFLRPPHAHRAPNRRELGIVRHEVTVVEYAASTAAVVKLEVTRDHGLAFPTLEYRASLVTDSDLSRGYGFAGPRVNVAVIALDGGCGDEWTVTRLPPPAPVPTASDMNVDCCCGCNMALGGAGGTGLTDGEPGGMRSCWGAWLGPGPGGGGGGP